MCNKGQMVAVCLLHYFAFCIFTSNARGLEFNHLKAETFNHRIKRDGGHIAFRPLFVYRQQEKEKQERWKLEAERKQQQYQLQNYQNSIEDFHKHPLIPTKSYYDAYQPVYPTYQTTTQYQTNPAYQQYQTNPAYQQYQTDRVYPANSYQIYSTFPYGSDFNYGLYANQQDSYYDDYSTSVPL